MSDPLCVDVAGHTNPAPPPGAERWPANKPVSVDILRWSRDNLKYPRGTVIKANVGGQDVIARIEWHCHRENEIAQPHGWHRGNTIYLPTSPLKPSEYGAQTPDKASTLAADEPPSDLYVLAGDRYIPAGDERSTSWPLVAAAGVAILVVTALFALAIHSAGRASAR